MLCSLMIKIKRNSRFLILIIIMGPKGKEIDRADEAAVNTDYAHVA